MVFNWREFCRVAQYICTNLDQARTGFSDEAAYRCAISRSYYAAFHSAHDFAQARLPYTPPPPDELYREHQMVIDAFKVGDGYAVASNLEELRDLRNDCDYHANERITHRNFDEGLVLARNIILSCIL